MKEELNQDGVYFFVEQHTRTYRPHKRGPRCTSSTRKGLLVRLHRTGTGDNKQTQTIILKNEQPKEQTNREQEQTDGTSCQDFD